MKTPRLVTALLCAAAMLVTLNVVRAGEDKKPCCEPTASARTGRASEAGTSMRSPFVHSMRFREPSLASTRNHESPIVFSCSFCG